MISLAFLGVGSFAELALAEKPVVMNCARMWASCENQAKTAAQVNGCMEAQNTCQRNNAAQGYNLVGKPLPPGSQTPPNNTVIILPSGDPPKGVGGETDSPTGDSFLPYKGMSTSKPTGRTVNGKAEMITENGKIWLWNGKTTQVMVLDTSRRQQYVAVRQGDPDVRMTAVVDGKKYNVASPAYAEALAKKQAQAPQPKPPLPPGPVCAGWGCPKSGPHTSTVVQESGIQKPKSPVSSPQVGGLNASGTLQPLNSPTKVAAPVTAPAAPMSIQRPGMPQLPQSQQYKLQNKQF